MKKYLPEDQYLVIQNYVNKKQGKFAARPSVMGEPNVGQG
jgi:hypothetical protein